MTLFLVIVISCLRTFFGNDVLGGELVISVSNGHKFGDWGPWQYCPDDNSAIGFGLKIQSPQGENADDTALNAVRLKCSDGTFIYSKEGS